MAKGKSATMAKGLIINNSKVEEDATGFKVVFLVEAKNLDKLWPDCEVDIFDEDLIKVRTLSTGPAGEAAVYTHTFPLSERGKDVKLRFKVVGEPIESWHVVSMPPLPAKMYGGEINIIPGQVKEGKSGYNIPFRIEVSDKVKGMRANCHVEIFDQDLNMVAVVLTGPLGEAAEFTYVNIPLTSVSDEVRLRFKIAGEPIEKWHTIFLPAATFGGWWGKVCERVMRQWPMKWKGLAIKGAWLLLIVIVTSFVVTLDGKVAILIGLSASYFVGRAVYKKNKNAGLATMIAFPVLSYIFPRFFVEPITTGLFLSLVIGYPFYVLEDLTKEEIDGKVEHLYNFYPRVPLGIGGLAIIFNIFGMMNFFPKYHANQFNDVIYLGDASLSHPIISSIATDFYQVIGWVLFMIITSFYSAPGEFKEVWGKKKNETGDGKELKGSDTIKDIFFFKEVWDIVNLMIDQFKRKER